MPVTYLNFIKGLHICYLSASPQKPYDMGGWWGRKEVSDLLDPQDDSSHSDGLSLMFLFSKKSKVPDMNGQSPLMTFLSHVLCPG